MIKTTPTTRHSLTINTFWKKSCNMERDALRFSLVSRTLKKRFPYLNLKGLKNINGLTVRISPLPGWMSDTGRNSIFHIENIFDMTCAGRITFKENFSTGMFECGTLYPNLPPSVKGAGATLFTLIVLRANSFANENIAITAMNKRSNSMALKMSAFKPQIITHAWTQQKDAILTVPKLTSPELNAVEWYWKYVLNYKNGDE